MKVLIMDQYRGPSPCALQESPMTFESLCEWAMTVPSYGESPSSWMKKPEIAEVDETTFKPAWCTTVYRANPVNGMAEMWRSNLDSSD